MREIVAELFSRSNVKRASRVGARVSKGQTEALAANKTAATSLFGNDSDREIAIRRAASNALAGELLSFSCGRSVRFLFSIELSISEETERWETPFYENTKSFSKNVFLFSSSSLFF